MSSSPAEIIKRWEAKQARKEPPPEAPTLHFHLPPIGTKEIVDSVMFNKGGWRTLEQEASETAEGIRQRRLSEKYDMTEIPRPEFEEGL